MQPLNFKKQKQLVYVQFSTLSQEHIYYIAIVPDPLWMTRQLFLIKPQSFYQWPLVLISHLSPVISFLRVPGGRMTGMANGARTVYLLWAIQPLGLLPDGAFLEEGITGERVAAASMTILDFYHMVAPDAVKAFYVLQDVKAVVLRYDKGRIINQLLDVRDLDDHLTILLDSHIQGLRFFVKSVGLHVRSSEVDGPIPIQSKTLLVFFLQHV